MTTPVSSADVHPACLTDGRLTRAFRAESAPAVDDAGRQLGIEPLALAACDVAGVVEAAAGVTYRSLTTDDHTTHD